MAPLLKLWSTGSKAYNRWEGLVGVVRLGVWEVVFIARLHIRTTTLTLIDASVLIP